MKKALPHNAKIAKDAKETVQECVSEFISFITSECVPGRRTGMEWAGLTRQVAPPRRASDKCQREKRKTINGDDLLWAMTTLGFEAYVEPLRGALARGIALWQDHRVHTCAHALHTACSLPHKIQRGACAPYADTVFPCC